jgi:hypothetical protein
MGDVSRRDMVKLTAGLFAGSGAAAAAPAADPELKKAPAAPAVAPARDGLLAGAINSPQGFMLSDAETFRLLGDVRAYDLLITSALNREGVRELVRVRPGSMRIFRADAGVDEFTKEGGLYWRIHDTEGRVKLKTPGAVVMVVREGSDTVRCYIMTPDFRC